MENDTTNEQNQKEYDECQAYETSYFDFTEKVANVISQFEQKSNRQAESIRSATPRSEDEAQLAHFGSCEAKLPVLKVPTFFGALDQLLEFKDAFTALVDANTSLSAIQKFYYLRSSLKNEPADMINSFEVSAANYNIAWTLLKERYENNRLILHNN